MLLDHFPDSPEQHRAVFGAPRRLAGQDERHRLRLDGLVPRPYAVRATHHLLPGLAAPRVIVLVDSSAPSKAQVAEGRPALQHGAAACAMRDIFHGDTTTTAGLLISNTSKHPPRHTPSSCRPAVWQAAQEQGQIMEEPPPRARRYAPDT